MRSYAKHLLQCFATGLFAAAGGKLGEYLVERLTGTRHQNGAGATGSTARELCDQCGRIMKRVSKSLFCINCGYREG
jgi:hypothetical protein